jgi:hypothetical protein
VFKYVFLLFEVLQWEDEICIFENVGGVDEVFANVNIIPSQSHSFSNVESVH